MGDVLTRAIGWYGKLPWVGDFVGHGLPWQRAWDNWLQRSLPAAEAQWGHAALRHRVRGMAPWQLLLPAADGQGLAWCGIVAGSTDRVGRVFPVIVAEALPQATLDPLPLLRLQARMLALSDWLWDAAGYESLEQFEAGTEAWAASAWAPASMIANGGGQVPDTVADLRRAHGGAAAFWWRTEPVPDVREPLADTWPPSGTLLPRLLASDAH